MASTPKKTPGTVVNDYLVNLQQQSDDNLQKRNQRLAEKAKNCFVPGCTGTCRCKKA